jgi:hypothetical protein
MNIYAMFGAIGLVFVIAVAAFVDFYKKFIRGYYVAEGNETVRKTKAKDWEIRLVAGVMSVGLATALYFTVKLPFVNYLAIIPYSIVIYMLQKPTCMTIIKKISNAIAKAWLKKHGIVLEGFKYDE